MKKWMKGCLVLTMVAALTACGEGGNADKRNLQSTSNVKDVLNGQMAENAKNAGQTKSTQGETKASGEITNGSGETKDPSQDESQYVADVDLTKMSSTMVYSEVYNMMVTPDQYIGKIVKMQGSFQYFQDETTGNEYFSCLIKDATACCAQGIEFILAGDYVYPVDYPELNAEITVCGVFDTYYEGDYRYCTLRNAQLSNDDLTH